MDDPKVGDIVRMTSDVGWYPEPQAPYVGSRDNSRLWSAGTTLVVVSVNGREVILRPLSNDQRIGVATDYMWENVEPI